MHSIAVGGNSSSSNVVSASSSSSARTRNILRLNKINRLDELEMLPDDLHVGCGRVASFFSSLF
jgi:hypothetical protein